MSNIERAVKAIPCLFLFLSISLSAQTGVFKILVVDQLNNPIQGCLVRLKTESGTVIDRTTDSDGTASFDNVPAAAFTANVSAKGFAPLVRNLTAESLRGGRVEITLAAAPVSEQVVVSAARTETSVGDSAASVAILGAADIAATGALKTDDVLRQVVGFSLFRRSSSRVSNPTTQGVSLRGTGASGASRAFVVEDGVPLTDPFGGWVYWSRVPRSEISNVEIVRGGSSALFGTDAMGGVINVGTRRPVDSALSADISYGTENTPDVSFFASTKKAGWGISLATEVFDTDGYILVDQASRGTIDIPSTSKQAAVDITVDRKFGRDSRAFFRGSTFNEARSNGTPVQENATHIREGAGGVDFVTSKAGDYSVRSFVEAEKFDQDFTAISADRTAESLTRLQRSPSQAVGFSFQWTFPIKSQTLIAGTDLRWVRGSSDEIAFVAGNSTSWVDSGGRERSGGLFFEDIIRATSRLILTVNGRFDDWKNYRGQSLTRSIKTNVLTVANFFPDRTESDFSPHASALYSVTRSLSLTTSFYKAFRAPTLNELYRSFRVGNVLTLANENLRSERLIGGEAGLALNFFNGNLTSRMTYFLTDINQPVSNITLSVTPALITRQRQNTGTNRSSGLEAEVEARIGQHWFVKGGYMFADSFIKSFPANPAAVGLRVPQVPRNQGTLQVRYTGVKGWLVALQARAAGEQFDDDQNLFRLRPYFAVDGMVSRRISNHVELYAAVENLLNSRYDVGLTPIRTTGPPITARAGVRLDFARR